MPISSLTSGNGTVHTERIFTYSPEMLGTEIAALAIVAPVGAAYPDGIAFYIPVRVESTITAKTLGCSVTNAGTSAQIDMGIYNSSGTRLVSKGLTNADATGSFQNFDITDTVLLPGLYYVGIVGTNNSAAHQGLRFTGTLQKAFYSEALTTGVALPATATFANPGSDYLPVVAINRGTVAL